MAPSSGDIYKDYFNDPTLSDLTIRLSDRTVHVHRIVLCRRSKYFNKLILNGFKESSLNEIPLHGDDPVVMMALFRYIYDLPYEPTDKDSEWQFLARVYIAADKYEVEGLVKDVTRRMKLKFPRDGYLASSEEDFFAAVKLVFDNTISQDATGRTAMVDLCVCCIGEFKGLQEFQTLLSECDGLGAAIIAHEKLSLMLDGTYLCGPDEQEHRAAVPRCSSCGEEFTASEIRRYSRQLEWDCPCCYNASRPVCTGHQGVITGFVCRWVLEM